jgi:hypothetical protein
MRITRQQVACVVAAGVLAAALPSPSVHGQSVAVTRFLQNPLVTVDSSPTLGANVNGPTVIRVPDWVQKPLGRYYMYFGNHRGDFIRLAYADAVTGPWTVHAPGVLHARETAFYRPQPDPQPDVMLPGGYSTHLASPEILIDHERRRIVMWTHGWYTNGEGGPWGCPPHARGRVRRATVSSRRRPNRATACTSRRSRRSRGTAICASSGTAATGTG